ncbi:hypothetical protein NBRC116583_03520 [Arenicella sp. 4NH20-0111]
MTLYLMTMPLTNWCGFIFDAATSRFGCIYFILIESDNVTLDIAAEFEYWTSTINIRPYASKL